MKMRTKLSFFLVFLLVMSILPVQNATPSADAASKKAKLKTKKITLTVGKSKAIKITNKNKKRSYLFTSSSKKIANVSKKGKVKAKKAGTAKIKVYEKYRKKKKTVKRKLGTVKVTVKKAVTPTPLQTPGSTSSATTSTQPDTLGTTTTDKPTETATSTPTSIPTATPVPTPEFELRINAQIERDSKNSKAVKKNEDGTSTVSVPASYSSLFIPIGDQDSYDLSAYTQMVIDYKIADQVRISIFDSKFTNIKPPTSGTAEWSQWEYIGSGSYDGEQIIDITSYDREQAAYIVLSSPSALSMTLRSIQFVGDSRLELDAQHSEQMESGNPTAELSTSAGETTIQFLANSATVMLPLGEKTAYNLSQYTTLKLDLSTDDPVYVGLFNSKSVNILPGSSESDKWWEVTANTAGEISFDLSQIPVESLTNVAYVAIRIETSEIKPVKVRKITFLGDAHKEKVKGEPIANVLTIDCGEEIRTATHCGSGSLYGVTESTPADIEELVAPLHPNMFTQPARSGNSNQHPFGDALAVASRLSDTGATVTIRLSDICPGWPYRFPGMDEWKEIVSSVIDDKLAATNTNFYGYEIWNEPTGTWTSTTISFEELWLETYKLIRQKDPSAAIIGPSLATYDKTSMQSFLEFCIKNNCLPDIMCWHELTNVGNTASNIKAYRELEKSLNITPLRITINEYCDGIKEREGAPGPCAAYIAKFERHNVDTACLSWWFSGEGGGSLGSLLSSPTTKGAGWYFFKWYGDMTGNMLSVTPPNEDSKYVDGFASLDSDKKELTCLFGGDNDGSIEAAFNHLPSWVTKDSKIKVEKVEWEGRKAESQGPVDITASSEIEWNEDSVSVTILNCDDTTGYRIAFTQ